MRDNFATINGLVKVTRQIIDLIFPEIGQRREESGVIAIQGGIADGHFRFVGVAGKSAAKRRSGRR